MEDQSSVTEFSNLYTNQFISLDKRVITLWGWVEWILIFCVMFPSLIGIFVSERLVGEWRIWLVVGWIIIAALWIWHSFWYPPRAYENWGYRITAQVLEIRSGRLFQVTRLLPLNRLQHVDLQQGPLERWLGLARLILHTAGSQDASITVPGLAHEDAVILRNRLIGLGGADVA